MIGLKEYFMGRDTHYPPSDELRSNAVILVGKANKLMLESGLMRGVRSGYRPPEINAQVPNASPHSKHMTCQAVDLEDNDGKIKTWCLKNLDFLADTGLWMESPESTPSWLHVQSVSPLSGHRVFLP